MHALRRGVVTRKSVRVSKIVRCEKHPETALSKAIPAGPKHRLELKDMENNASSPEGESPPNDDGGGNHEQSTGGSFKRAAVGEEAAGDSSRESPHQKRARGGSPNSSNRDGSSDDRASARAEPAPAEQGLPGGAGHNSAEAVGGVTGGQLAAS